MKVESTSKRQSQYSFVVRRIREKSDEKVSIHVRASLHNLGNYDTTEWMGC